MSTVVPYTSLDAYNQHTQERVYTVVDNNRNTWSSLLKCDLESCCVSYVMPYHVIGTIGKGLSYHYTLLFMSYFFFFTTLSISYSAFAHGLKSVCNKNHYTNWCFTIHDKDTCVLSFSIIDNERYECAYDNEYKTCYASTNVCLTQQEYNTTWKCWGFLYFISSFILTSLHLYIRRQLRKHDKQSIPHVCKDLCIVIWCNTCSLAQQYRAINNKDLVETIEV